jgi:hypothetical protein
VILLSRVHTMYTTRQVSACPDHNMGEVQEESTTTNPGYPEVQVHLWERKSFADDLNMERGIVSMKVALCHDLLRFSGGWLPGVLAGALCRLQASISSARGSMP